MCRENNARRWPRTYKRSIGLRRRTTPISSWKRSLKSGTASILQSVKCGTGTGSTIHRFSAIRRTFRKEIHTTNAIESLNMSLRKVIKTRGSFPNADAAMKLLFLALEHIAKKWTMPVQNWKVALQRFAILLGDRVPQDALA